MSRWINQDLQDYIVNDLATCTSQVMCSQQPATYFNAVRPPLWTTNTSYSVGDIVHQPTENGKVYECTVGGTSGAVEPAWGTVQDSTFSDNTVTWKTHNNYSLVHRSLESGDFAITDDIGTGGRRLTVSEEMGITSHAAGTVTHVALIKASNKSLRYVSTATTTVGNGQIEAGRTTKFFELVVIVADPVE